MHNIDGVQAALLEHYQCLLGTAKMRKDRIQEQVISEGPILSEMQIATVLQPVTEGEAKEALWPIPDYFGFFFYKDSWVILGNDVTAAVLDFLNSGKLLKEVNNTILTLIFKVKCPSNVTEYRTIACCNSIYKCITKIICRRIKFVLPDIYSCW